MRGDAESVRALNQRFYEALSKQNMLAMEEIWSHDPNVRCVHPGLGLIEGWDAIRNSLRDLLNRSICMTVIPEEPRVTIVGPAAIVTCRESVSSFTLDGSTTTAAQATHVFEKRDGRWQLIHRHASALPGAEPPAAPH